MSLYDTRTTYTEHLLGKKNVVGVGEGDGTVVVLVTCKEPLSELSAQDVVEPELDGYPTEVIEVGIIKALCGESCCSCDDNPNSTNHTTGLRPGASVGRQNGSGTGTLGCLVLRDGKLSLLSNNHVIGGNNSAPPGTNITHPGPADSSNRPVVAKLTETVPIVFSSSGNNRLDASVAEITDVSRVVGNDAVKAPVAGLPAVGTVVTKTGRTTGTNTGTVQALNATVTVNYGNSGSARFVGQIVTTEMLSPGDSGSVGHLSDGRPFGLGFAGSSSSSVYNPIGEVFEALQLSLPDADDTEPPLPPGETPPEERPTLQRGDEGPWVELLQNLLRGLGYTIDRFDHAPFGPQTETAVREFQQQQQLPVTGVVDTATWIKLENPDDTPTDPGGKVPEALTKMKDELLAKAFDHGLEGLTFSGIAPSSATAYGYHNSRSRHEAGFTRDGLNDYSIQVPLDKEGDALNFSALDLGSNNSTGRRTTRVLTERLKAATDANDPRVSYLREFYGSLDNETVLGRTHDSLEDDWGSSSADNSHLWHIHLSFFRKYANDPLALAAVLEVLLGLPVDDPPVDPPADPPNERLPELIDELVVLLNELKENL